MRFPVLSRGKSLDTRLTLEVRLIYGCNDVDGTQAKFSGLLSLNNGISVFEADYEFNTHHSYAYQSYQAEIAPVQSLV